MKPWVVTLIVGIVLVGCRTPRTAIIEPPPGYRAIVVGCLVPADLKAKDHVDIIGDLRRYNPFDKAPADMSAVTVIRSALVLSVQDSKHIVIAGDSNYETHINQLMEHAVSLKSVKVDPGPPPQEGVRAVPLFR